MDEMQNRHNLIANALQFLHRLTPIARVGQVDVTGKERCDIFAFAQTRQRPSNWAKCAINGSSILRLPKLL
ncbi:hypothetical protein JTM31_36685, partial [Pseudomonas aeruginosa]|nr:hypothetical protein [Pseudomonas aeruginosa]